MKATKYLNKLNKNQNRYNEQLNNYIEIHYAHWVITTYKSDIFETLSIQEARDKYWNDLIENILTKESWLYNLDNNK